MSEHTPTPWAVEDRRAAPLPNVRIVASGREVAQVHDVHMRDCLWTWTHAQADELDAMGLANAEFIVRACNCHEELVAGLEHALLYVQNGDFRNGVEQHGQDEGVCRALAFADELQGLIAKAKSPERSPP